MTDSFSLSQPNTDGNALRAAKASAADDERPPQCPTCRRRLVMLATHWGKDDMGASIRRQLWGCPRGHATAHRVRGLFTPVELLETLHD